MLAGDAQVGTEGVGTRGEPGCCCKHRVLLPGQEGSGKQPPGCRHMSRAVTGSESPVRVLSELGAGEFGVSLN